MKITKKKKEQNLLDVNKINYKAFRFVCSFSIRCIDLYKRKQEKY